MARRDKKLTKTVVDALQPADGEYFVWDRDLTGFGVRVYPNGRKAYVVQTRNAEGRTRRPSLGRHGQITADLARKKALEVLSDFAKGQDPSAKKKATSNNLSVTELCERYCAEVLPTKKASTQATDTGRINRHILPLLGSRRVRSLTKDDIQRFVADVTNGKTRATEKTKKHGVAVVLGGSGTARRTTGLLGGILTYAVEISVIDSNPALGVKRTPDQKRERFLSDDEMNRVGLALTDAESDGANVLAVAAIRLFMLTGCRKSEILSLRRDEVDFQTRHLRLTDAKTGPRSVPLNDAAIRILEDLPRIGSSPFVFPSDSASGHIRDVQYLWRKIRKTADVEDVTIHDLRRTFGSKVLASGFSTYMVQKLLGHRDIRTTQIYAHYADDARQEASNVTAARIAEALGMDQRDE